MTPTEDLKHEHKVVLLVLGGAEREAAAMKGTGGINTVKLEKIVDFSKNFTDKCHHAKEEKHLFPRLQERGITEPVAVMLREHEEGRALIAAIAGVMAPAAGGDPAAAMAASEALEDYVALLRAHIEKENNVLFVMADKALSAEDQTELAEAFEKVELEETGEGVHEKYHVLAHEIAEQ